MKTELKLYKIIQDKKITRGAIELDAGLIVNEYKHAIYYLSVKFSDHFKVFLEINDDGGPPYKNIFVEGKGPTLNDARKNAMEKFIHAAYFTKLH